MNILYLCDEYPPCNHGGIGSVTQTLARELFKKGHNIFVCGFYPYFRPALPFEDDLGVKVFRHFYGSRLILQLSRRKFLGKLCNIEKEFNSYIQFILQFIDDNKIELIEIPDFNEAFRYSGPRFIKYPYFKVPMILKVHGTYNFINQITNSGLDIGHIYIKEKFLIDQATKLVATSGFSKEKTIEVFNYKKEINVIYNGTIINNKINYIEDKNYNVVFAGKISVNKGIYGLIRAWEKVILRVPSAKLLLFGNGGIKDIRKVKDLVKNEKSKSIELKGFIVKENLPVIYSTAACAIFPSLVENFSMAPLESMQVGCPTIFTKRASGKELIADKVNGILVDPDDIDEIANAIIFMLTDRKSAIQMGEKGAETIREKFDISSIADEHLQLYRSIIK